MRVFAHRGSKLEWPENTMLAFRLAHEAGATGFETDLRLSGDGQIVLVHDATLERVGDPSTVVLERRAAQLASARVRSIDGSMSDGVATLETLLTAYPDKDYIFDCKVDDAELFERLAELLERLGFHDRVWFLTWSAEADRHLARCFPGAKQFPNEKQTVLWGVASIVGLGAFVEPANEVLSLPAHHFGLPVFRRDQISSIRSRGKTFMGYLVNEERDFRRVRACGVDCVLTDRATFFARWMASTSPD